VADEIKSTRFLQGTVISNKMQKTVVVKIVTRVLHPKYEKIVTRTTKVKAHDETNQCKVGDVVSIGATRPLSKLKHWQVVKVLEKAT
jgi:small subunit ribosomal protein S17